MRRKIINTRFNTGLPLTELATNVEDRHQRRKMVHDAANPHSTTARTAEDKTRHEWIGLCAMLQATFVKLVQTSFTKVVCSMMDKMDTGNSICNA